MIYAFLAYFFWGFFPLYWKFLDNVSVNEILSHRVFWAFIFYSIILFIKNKKMALSIPKSKKSLWILSLASVALMLNWFVYIYAVNSNQIIESSLGYFINPLVNILFGITFLKERLNRTQTIAVILATIGVGIISFDQGHLPWIALILAVSFSLYGLLKKLNPHPTSALESNQFESLIFAPLALGFILYHLFFAPAAWTQSDSATSTSLLLIGAGIATGLPLILFAEAARRIPYYLMGFFQFLAPTLQFATGVIIFHEPLSQTKLTGFAVIWLGILYLMLNQLLVKKKKTT